MLRLDSIRIRNFRAIRELTFRPHEEGITGIFGPNGAGKSSILTGVLFALYGETPKGITNGALRRSGSGTDECSVSVVFTHLGQQIEVIREISGKNNTVIANIYVDGNPETKTKPSEADNWVRKRLGIDAEGFLTAFVVRQKELDSFVRATPADRKRIIEKLAGVETINKALKAARENERDSKKTVDLLPGSQDTVDATASEVQYYTEQNEEAVESLAVTENTLKAMDEERLAAQQVVVDFTGKQEQLKTITANIQSIDTMLPELENQLERVKYVKELSEGENVETLRAKHQSVTTQLAAKREELSSATAQITRVNGEISSLQTIIEKSAESLTQLAAQATMTQAEVEETIRLNMEQLDAVKTEGTKLAAQSADLEESLKMLAGKDECPTCQHHLENPKTLIRAFTKTVENNAVKREELLQEHKSLTQKSQELNQLQTMVHSYETQKVEQAERKERLEVLQSDAADFTDPATLRAAVAELETIQTHILELGIKAKDVAQDRELFTSLTERKEQAELAKHQFLTQSMELNKELEKVNLVESQQKLNSMESEYKALQNAKVSYATQAAESAVKFENARSSYQRAYDQWEKKQALQEAHETHTLTTDMLDKFRQEVVASIAPEISDYATTLINDMTDGHFVEVKLDEDFKASIVNNAGEELPSAWLSGGEESAVALALRLAVGFLITGGNPDLLWLDEPLTAQDKDRRASILSMIRELPIQQILLINHAQEAQDIVDYEITLTKE